MEDYLQIFNVSIITLSVYAIIYALRKATDENEKFKKFIPLISLMLGSSLGCLIYLFTPELIQESNILSSILVGGISGLAATGGNQIFKQLNDNKDDSKK